MIDSVTNIVQGYSFFNYYRSLGQKINKTAVTPQLNITLTPVTITIHHETDWMAIAQTRSSIETNPASVSSNFL